MSACLCCRRGCRSRHSPARAPLTQAIGLLAAALVFARSFRSLFSTQAGRNSKDAVAQAATVPETCNVDYGLVARKIQLIFAHTPRPCQRADGDIISVTEKKRSGR